MLTTPDAAIQMLVEAGIVLLPTDTVPGLHCRADSSQAITRLGIIKGRDATKPYVLLCESINQVLDLADNPDDSVIDYMEKCWPGPLTAIVMAGTAASALPQAKNGSLALRVPAPVWLRGLVAAVGCPLISTSANEAGNKPCRQLAEARDLFADRLDGAVSDTVFPSAEQTGQPSSLLDLTGWPPRLLRPGGEPPPPWS
ncbi:MAG: L-threonylcarbamoyladenylate synthase [bacterium]